MGFNKELQPYYSEVDLLSTQGRLGRRSYFVYSVILPFIFFWILASLAGAISKYGASLGSISVALSYLLLALAVVIISIIMVRLTILRCHDFNMKGWLAVLSLIPMVNIIFALIPGNNGLNSYGDQPEPPSLFIKMGVVVLTILLISSVLFTLYKVGGITHAIEIAKNIASIY